MKHKINCFLICFMIICSNMIHTSSITNRIRLSSGNKLKNKLIPEEALLPEKHMKYKTLFSLLEKNHEEAENADLDKHYDIEQDSLTVLKELQKHYQEELKNGIDTHMNETEAIGYGLSEIELNSTRPYNDTYKFDYEMEGEGALDLEHMTQDLNSVVKNKTEEIVLMGEAKDKNRKQINEGREINIKREMELEERNELNNEVRQRFASVEKEGLFDEISEDDEHTEGSEKILRELARESNKQKNNAFLQKSKYDINVFPIGAGIMKSCLSGFFQETQAPWAWKKHPDVGKVDFQGPPGYFKWGEMYYKNCRTNYKMALGVCWVKCKRHYLEVGPLCKRCYWTKCKLGLIRVPCPKCHTYWRHSYVTHQLTNFDSRVRCKDPNRYKEGALCYRDCGRMNDGYENCGFGACATSPEACKNGYIDMAGSALAGAVTFAVFVYSGGISGSGVTQATIGGARKLLSKVGDAGKMVVKGLKKVARNPLFKRNMISRSVKSAKKNFWKFVEKSDIHQSTKIAIKEKKIELICKEVADGILNKIEKSEKTQIKDLDFTGTYEAVTTCNDDTKEGIECAAKIMDVISMVDPTGLSAIAGAVMKPRIDR